MNHLNYKHLRYFWTVAKTGSIAKAADQLFLTPQSISGQLTEFAQALGIELFTKRGRNLELTDAGRQVLGYADSIFAVGDELLAALHQEQSKQTIPLRVGIADSVSKSLAYQLLEPALKLKEKVRLIAREGRLIPLLSELSINRLDLVIADRPMPPQVHVKGFSHLVSESHLGVFAAPNLKSQLKGDFPSSLFGLPFLLPGEDVAIRPELDKWLSDQQINPLVMGEFDDSALMKSFAQAGAGVCVAPLLVSERVERQYGLALVGKLESITEKIYLITTAKRITHPAIKAISEQAPKH